MLGKIIPTCYYTGKDTEDAGLLVEIKPKEDEKILIFEIDDQTNKNSPFRRYGLKGKCCDALVYYYAYEREKFYNKSNKKYNKITKRRHQRAKIKFIICLVELKTKDVNYAIEQVINTYNFIENWFQDENCKPSGYRAYICIQGSSPREITEEQEFKLNSTFNGRRNWKISPTQNITEFLRKNI